MLGDHNLWRKTYASEGSTKVPFLVVPPASVRFEPGQVSAAPVELRDIMPTLLEGAGLNIPDTIDGSSLLPILKGEQEMHYITYGRKKFVWLPRVEIEQFFDLENDPTECQDLSSSLIHRADLDCFRSNLIASLEKRYCVVSVVFSFIH